VEVKELWYTLSNNQKNKDKNMDTLNLTSDEFDFANALVKAMTGFGIDQLPSQNHDMVEKCLQTFYGYITAYFQEHFHKKSCLQIAGLQKYTRPQIDEIPGMSDKFDEAYNSFLKLLV
jgi:hypothetical protein